MTNMLLYVTAGMALVLIARRPVRHAFGAGPAFTLWLLPPLLASLPWLPAVPDAWSIAPAVIALPDVPILGAPSTPDANALRWPLWLWFGGSAFCLLRLALQYGRLLRQGQRLPEAMQHALCKQLSSPRELQRLRLHPAGPAVLWAPRSLLLLPTDFLTRFDAHEQRLVLRHEFTHLHRGDALWSLLAELAAALLWFHPLAWLALPRLRLDQELACDERVLRQLPQEEIRYARTLLHSTGMDTASVLIPWLSQPQLKERLNMIQRHRPGTLRRRSGFIALALLMTGTACMTQAATGHHKRSSQNATQNLSFNSQLAPAYPAAALKNKEQGTVVLTMHIGADGKPISSKVDPTTQAAPDLIKAASDAAMTWRFKPRMKDGKPVEGYARVPVTFSLDPLTPAAPAAPASPPPSSSLDT
jgi:TonB family protein